MDALLPKPSKLPNEKPTLKYLAKEESEAPRTSFTNKENGKQKEVLDIIHNGPQAWAENRKKWLQKSEKVNDSKLLVSHEKAKAREISIDLYGEIEKTIRSTSSPYVEFSKQIRLADLVEILDDLWDDEE